MRALIERHYYSALPTSVPLPLETNRYVCSNKVPAGNVRSASRNQAFRLQHCSVFWVRANEFSSIYKVNKMGQYSWKYNGYIMMAEVYKEIQLLMLDS